MKATIMRICGATALAVALWAVVAAQDFSATADEVTEWRVAAEKGEAWAQNNLGVAYEYGAGVSKDGQEAVRWYRKAAEQGLAQAQVHLGSAYSYDGDDGVAKDKREAVRWYRKAAEQGLAQAQVRLGNAYFYDADDVFAEDKHEAVRWYHKAAEQGLALAQFNLGNAYSGAPSGASAEDDGIAEDIPEATRWYRKAAEQGFASAQYELGKIYLGTRIFFLRDKREAVRWLRKAADQGVSHAQYHLGIAYRDGEGVITDAYEAYIWLSIAKLDDRIFTGSAHIADEALQELNWRDILTQTEIRSAQKEAKQRLEAIDRREAENTKKRVNEKLVRRPD